MAVLLPRLNAAEMLVDVAKPDGGVSTRWMADSGALDLFLLLGPKPADVMAQYAQISGTTAMPQVSCPSIRASSRLCSGRPFAALPIAPVSIPRLKSIFDSRTATTPGHVRCCEILRDPVRSCEILISQ